MLEAKQAMFIAWGPQLAFLYNDAYAPIFGAKHPHALGRPFAEVWSDIWQQIKPLVDTTLAGQASWHEDLLIPMQRHGYLEEAWFSFSYTPVRDESCMVAGMFCAATETTDKVLAERRKVAERERLRQMFEQAPGIMAMLRSPEHIFEQANAAYYQLIGHRDVLGKPVREALPEVEGQGFFELLDGVYQSGEPFVGHGVPVALQREPGGALEQRFVDFVYQPIREADGQVTGIFVEGFDVTEAKRAEEALRESQRRLNAVLSNATVSVFLMDERQQCIYMNAAAEKLTGYTPEEVQGRPLHDVIHHTRPDGTHFPLEECPIDRAFPEEHQVQGEEVFVHKDGRFYPVAFTASPVWDEEAKTIGTIIEVRDITAEKRAQEHQRLLINELNHRVKNTLATVQSIASQTLRDASSPGDAREAIDNRLVALSRAHDVLTRENWEGAGLREIVDQAVAPYGSSGERRFEVSGSDVRLSPRTALALAMALQELATNAVKYGALSNGTGTVGIKWRVDRNETPPHLHLEWTESGGPPVIEPKRRGFGTRLIERSLAQDLTGEVRIEFAPAGVICTVDAPLPHS
jgi:PAS domain S-box-containing protein